MDIPVSKLLDSGLCNNGKNTFRLFNWIEGVEIIKVIGILSEKEQYEYGYKAGAILRKIHEIGSPSNRSSWSEHYHQKIDNKIAGTGIVGLLFQNSSI